MHPTGTSLQVFKLSLGWRFILLLVYGIGALGALAGPVAWLINEPALNPAQLGLLLGGLVVSALCVWAIKLLPRYRIEISEDSILYQTALSARSLRFEDAAGFRILPTQNIPTLQIMPKHKAHKKLQISLTYERKEQLIASIASVIPNLDDQQFAEELKEIAANQELGTSEEDRLVRLAKARKVIGALNVLTMGAGAWGFFYPQPYGYAMGVLLALPVLGLIALIHFRGFARFDTAAKSAYPSVSAVMLLPAILLSFRAFREWSILDWSSIWLPFAVVAVAIAAAIFAFVPETRKGRGKVVLVAAIALLYGYGALIHCNCFYDRSRPTHSQTKVVNKHVSTGKYTTHELTLSPFAEAGSREVDVSEVTYANHPIGSSVDVYSLKGRFGIPWFVVE